MLSLLAFQACNKDDDDDNNNPSSSNDIEITYSIEAERYEDITKVYGNVEYADAGGIQKKEISGPWETTVAVPRGHNLYFRFDGTIEQGDLVVKATAVDKSNGKVVFNDQLAESTSWGTKAAVDFTIEGKDLGN